MSNFSKCAAFTTAALISSIAIFNLALHANSHRGVSENAPESSGYHVAKTIPVGGDGFWDYAVVDSDARRVYVSHGTHVVVLDADTQAVVGDIPDTQGVHGIA